MVAQLAVATIVTEVVVVRIGMRQLVAVGFTTSATYCLALTSRRTAGAVAQLAVATVVTEVDFSFSQRNRLCIKQEKD